MMYTRFFTKKYDGEHATLMLFFVDDEEKLLFEFKVIDGQLVPTDEIVGFLMMGDTRIDEISHADAIKFYPHIEVDKLVEKVVNAS